MSTTKIFKTFCIVLISIILLATLIIALLVTFVNPNNFKDKISQAVYQRTHRTLTIKGDVQRSFFPWLGVKITDVALSNTATFKNTTFAQIGEVGIRIRLLSLFTGKIEIEKIVLKDFDLELIKNANGDANWQNLVGTTSKDVSLQQVSDEPSSEHSIQSQSLQIGDISINNGHLSWRNDQTRKKFEINDFNLNSKNISFNEPFTVKINGTLKTFDPDITTDLKITSQVTLNSQGRMYSLQQLQVSGKFQKENLAKPIEFDGSTDLVADLNKQTLDLNNLNFKLANLEINASAKGTAIIDAPKFNGSLAISEFNPEVLIKYFTKEEATPLVNDSQINEKQKVHTASLKGEFATTSKFVKFPKIEIQFDKTTAIGSGSYSHFDDKYVMFNFAINKVDLDSILSDASKKTALPANAARYEQESSPEYIIVGDNRSSMPMINGLRQVKLAGDIKVSELIAKKLHLSDINVQIDGNNGLIKCNPTSFNFYRGHVNNDIAIDVRKAMPQITIKTSMGAVELQPLLKDLSNSDKVSGIASLDGTFNTKGKSAESLIHNIAGSGKLTVNNGTYHGVDIAYQVRRGNAMINRKPLPEEQQSQKTDFGVLTADFKLADGIVATNDLFIQAPDFKVTGNGIANYRTKMLGFHLSAYSMRDSNFYVPIIITNTFDNPTIRPDMAVLMSTTVKNAIQDQINKHLGNGNGNGTMVKQLMDALPLDKLFNVKGQQSSAKTKRTKTA